jgi:hypothetical protein
MVGSIVTEKEYTDPNQQDDDDARSIYETLEKEIVSPLLRAQCRKKSPWNGQGCEGNRCALHHSAIQLAFACYKEYVTEYYMPAIE